MKTVERYKRDRKSVEELSDLMSVLPRPDDMIGSISICLGCKSFVGIGTIPIGFLWTYFGGIF